LADVGAPAPSKMSDCGTEISSVAQRLARERRDTCVHVTLSNKADTAQVRVQLGRTARP